MAIIFSASPGTASQTFKKRLEIILKCKSLMLNSDRGVGHMLIDIPAKKKILKKFKLNFFDKTKLIYGHIFPTKKNLVLLDYYYGINHFIISYRNIYEQLNYYYKWQKYKLRGPLNFPEDEYFSNLNEFSSNHYNIDLNLLLVLNFYKHWFYLIQNNKIKNFTLFSFEEIKSSNEEYQKKIKNIFKKLDNQNTIKFDNNIKENVQKKEKFEIHTRHKQMIEDFISFHKDIDFNLII